VRIAIVGPAHPYKGGAAQHTTALAHRLSAAGHATVLTSWHAQYPKLLYPGQLTVDMPEAEPYPGMERPLAWYRPDSWWLTGRRLARQGFDAVVLSIVTPVQAPAYLTLARAAQAGGCTVVALCHNVLPHESRRLDEPLMRALLRRMDAVIVHSSEQAALAGTLTSAPVQVAALPPHLPHTGPVLPAGPEPQGPHHRLLFFGIVRRYKGLDLLLRALAEVGPPVSLTVAGEIWEGRDDLLRLISDLGLPGRVTLSGGYVPTGDIPAIFAAADALVLPYRSATASQNALIAFQLGVPVIASRAGAIADAVEDGVNGILCAPGDAGDLARAIKALYEPGVLDRLRRGVRPPGPGLWDDYLAAVVKAISAGQPRGRMSRPRRGIA
jgi:glycosyltransferase involved in cell wall biosynthesis